jgi:DNA-binding NarL/FixJ family response regulator
LVNSIRRIRLFIVDPQPLIAAALQHFFAASDDFNVIETAQHVRLTMLRTIRPDVVLLAREHGSNDICESIAVAKDAVPATKIFLLSCHTHPEMVRRVLDAGASGYAVKDIAPIELTNALRSVADGRTYLTAALRASRSAPASRLAAIISIRSPNARRRS